MNVLGQTDGKRAAFSGRTMGFYGAAMGLNDMLHNGQPQPGAAHLATSGLVHPVKPFKQPGQMFS